jgi:hypothetical protein
MAAAAGVAAMGEQAPPGELAEVNFILILKEYLGNNSL